MRGDFVQILHTGHLHWLCVSNVSRRSGSVNLCESMFSVSIPTCIKEQIASLVHELDKDEIEVLVQPVQQQTNSTDCGVFALAFATAICFGYDVRHCHFEVEKMRPHLWKNVWKCFHASVLARQKHPRSLKLKSIATADKYTTR